MFSIWNNLPSSSSGQNPGNADKMGVSGVDLCPLALFWLYITMKMYPCSGRTDTVSPGL